MAEIPANFKTSFGAADIVIERVAAEPIDIEETLEVSAGTDAEGTKVFRPYYVAARLLSMRRAQLKQAEGVEFRHPREVAQEYFDYQLAIDRRYELTIPAGMSANVAKLNQQAAGSGQAAVKATF